MSKLILKSNMDYFFIINKSQFMGNVCICQEMTINAENGQPEFL